MITKDLFPNLQWGQLFFDKTKEHIDSYYTLPPSLDLDYIPDTNNLKYTDTPPSSIEQDFDKFFNFINKDLDSIDELALKIVDSLNSGDAPNSRSLLNIIINNIGNLHPFFQYNTKYHVCDLLIHTYIFENIDSINENELPEIIQLLCCFVFEPNFSEIEDICDKFIQLYSNLSEFQFIERTSTSSHKNEFNLLHSYAKEFPNSKLNYKTFQWQQYLINLSNSFEKLHRLPPYTLTNHAMEYYKEFLPFIDSLKCTLYSVFSNTKHVYFSNDEIDREYRTDISPSLYDEYHRTIRLILDMSYKETDNTYAINSFEDYFFATLLKIIESNHKIVYCPQCMKYHLAPVCEFSATIQEIINLYNNFITRQKAKYSDKYKTIISKKYLQSKPQLDSDRILFLWNNFEDFHYYLFKSHLSKRNNTDVLSHYKDILTNRYLHFNFLCNPSALAKEHIDELVKLLGDELYKRYDTLLKTCKSYATDTPK